MGIYSISDLSALTGIKTHTLRIWEKRYGLLKPQRTDTNIRYYGDEDLRVLGLVQKLNRHGIRISHIALMNPDQMEEECRQMTMQEDESEKKLLKAVRAMDVTAMDDVLDEFIRHRGFESALNHLILPFLDKMHVLSLGGEIVEGQEACLKELIKRKTNREIEALPQNCSGPRVIIFLPRGNHQELNHLFMHYMLRKQGLCVTDIGCDIQIECATSAIQKSGAQCVIVVNADPVHWQFNAFIWSLAEKTNLPIIVSGRASGEELNDLADKVIVLDDYRDTIRFVSRLQENLQHHLS